MKYEDRQYQVEAADSWFQDIKVPGRNPVIAVPTGGGKTVILGKLIKKYLSEFPYNRVTVLSHTQDILEQDHAALCEFFPDMPIGLYSSGLGVKDKQQLTVAGIQTAYRNVKEFEWDALFIVDEAHTVNTKDKGMYRTLLNNPHATVGGMSATVFRTGHGYIYEGEESLFNYLSYDLTSMDNYNKLVEDGYLTKLITLGTDLNLDVSEARTSAGDYNLKDLSELCDKKSITEEAIDETIRIADKDYVKWLVFAIDIKHADNITELLVDKGIKAKVLHSKNADHRREVVDEFKNGDLTALVSVGMITTGFDAPNVDLVVMLRPTKSPILHVQMIGRGGRSAKGKDHCLVLDFSENIKRLGPINDIKVFGSNGRKKGKHNSKVTSVQAKECPECRVLSHISATVCSICGYRFVPEKINSKATTAAVVAQRGDDSPIQWMNVHHVQYSIHSKIGSPDSLLVIYHTDDTRVKEWVCFNHGGYARTKALWWAKFRGYECGDTEEAFINSSEFKTPKRVLVDTSQRYPQIKNFEF